MTDINSVQPRTVPAAQGNSMPAPVDKDIQIPIGQQPSRTQTPQRTEEPLIGQVLGAVAGVTEKVVETGVRGALVVFSTITGRPDFHPDRLLDNK